VFNLFECGDEVRMVEVVSDGDTRLIRLAQIPHSELITSKDGCLAHNWTNTSFDNKKDGINSIRRNNATGAIPASERFQLSKYEQNAAIECSGLVTTDHTTVLSTAILQIREIKPTFPISRSVPLMR
jgi:hypothetical protein